MKKLAIIAVLVALAAALASAQVAEYRLQEAIYITAASGDTTLTGSWDNVGAQVYAYDADLWISYEPGATDPIKVPAERSYSINTHYTTLTLHRDGGTAALVTPVHK